MLINKIIIYKLELVILCMILISNWINFYFKKKYGGGGWKEVLNKENNFFKFFLFLFMFYILIGCCLGKKIIWSFLIKEVKMFVFILFEKVNEYFVRMIYKLIFK